MLSSCHACEKKVENPRQCTQGCGELGPQRSLDQGQERAAAQVPLLPCLPPAGALGAPHQPTSLLAGTGALATDMPHSLLSWGIQQTHPWAAVIWSSYRPTTQRSPRPSKYLVTHMHSGTSDLSCYINLMKAQAQWYKPISAVT